MFTPHDRDLVHARVLEWAQSDPRVVAGAVVGSLARQPGDRWSDLDLAFAVGEEVGIQEVLDDWSERLVEEFEAVRLFDVPSGGAIYRVFLLRGCLQFDLSFSPATQFGAIGPEFRLLFGTAIEKPSIGRHRRGSCSVTLYTMRCVRTYASSATATGKPSTGSAACATTR